MSEKAERPALESPGVRTALRRYARNAALIFVLGAALVIAFGAAAGRVEADASELERTGIRVPGVVTDYRPNTKVPGSIDVSYAYLDIRHSTVIHLDSNSPEYRIGEPVVVVIDRDDHRHVSIVGETNQSPWTVWPMVGALIAGVVLLPTGAVSLVRVWRQRRLLAAEPWRRTPARYREVPRGRGAVRGVILIDEGHQLRIFRIPDTMRSRLRRAGLRDRTDLELVGDLGDEIVVRAVRGPVFVSAKRPRRAASRRRWLRRAFPEGAR